MGMNTKTTKKYLTLNEGHIEYKVWLVVLI